MPINFPSFRTVDYGRAVREGQQIQENRLRNQILGMQTEELQNVVANRRKAQQIREQFERMPEQIDAMEKAGLFDEAAKLRQSYIDSRVNEVKILSTLRKSIDETNYKQFRQDMIQSGAIDGSMLPTEYSDDWFRDQIEKNKGKLESLTRRWGAEGRIMAQDLVQQDGSIVWEGKPYETQGSMSERRQREGGSGKPWEMQAGDTNSIRNAAAELYGGFYDPLTGRFGGLNREQQQQIAALVEEASRIYRERKGQLGHSEALAQAARKQGIRIEQLRGRPEDPLNLRQQPQQ